MKNSRHEKNNNNYNDRNVILNSALIDEELIKSFKTKNSHGDVTTNLFSNYCGHEENV